MFGEWLRQQREQRRLTRKEFADRVGCSIALLRKIENGERRPSAQIAELMANCLGISPERRVTFVKVARGELSIDHLSPISTLLSENKKSRGLPIPCIQLPVLPTPLIGRQREVEEICKLLKDTQCRLLTLVGPGGIGKTRLAIEAATQLEDAFADGTYFISLAHVNTPRLIVPVIADAIGFIFESASRTDAKTQLFGYLKEKQALILADNLEQLLAELGIEVLTELLSNAPHVKILATSRQSLQLLSEWIYEVQGLPIPENIYVEGSAQGTSVELFLQRARRAHVGFSATAEDFPAIVHICELVDGMPLAIELAAAWVWTLSCREIAVEIERGLDFLSVSAHDLPPRHRSMRAVFEHSWKLLSQEEKEVMPRLSVFRGGFQRQAAEQVAGASLSLLSALVMKSFVRRRDRGRYDLHELIRQYAADLLIEHPDENDSAKAKHGNYYLTYFGQADARLRSSAQKETLAELTLEMGNFRNAWDWAIEHREFALVEQTLRTFAMLFDTRGWMHEGLEFLARAVDALDTEKDISHLNRTEQVTLCHLLTTSALLTYRLAQHDQAQAMLERSLEILRPLHESRVLVETLSFLGSVMYLLGNYLRGLQLYDEALEVANDIDDRWFIALCLTEQVNGAMMLGNAENAYERLQAAVDHWRLIGDPRFIAHGLYYLGLSALSLGRYEEAKAPLEESVALNSMVGARWNLGLAYRGLGLVAQAQGEHAHAVEVFRMSLDTFAELGARQHVARVLAEKCYSVFALGNDSEAERGWRESLRIALETHADTVALEAIVGLAGLREKRGDFRCAFRHLSTVLTHPACDQVIRQRVLPICSHLQAALSPEEIIDIHKQAEAETLITIAEEVLHQA